MKLLTVLSNLFFVRVGRNESDSFPALPEAWAPTNAGTHAEPLYINKMYNTREGLDWQAVFFSVGLSMGFSNLGVLGQIPLFEPPSSRCGCNGLRSALSVPYLAVNAYGGYERQARSDQDF